MNIVVLCLALIFAALNASWFYHQRLWSRGVSVLFWLVLAMFTLDRQEWQLPAMVALLLVRVGFTIYERRTGKEKGAVEKITEKLQPDVPAPKEKAGTEVEKLRVATETMEVLFALIGPRRLQNLDGGEVTLPAGEHAWQIRMKAGPDDGQEPYYRLAECNATEDDRQFVFKRDLTAMIGIEECATDHGRTLVPWSEAPHEMHAVFRERCVLADCEVGDDGRVGFPMRVGGREYQVKTKYLAWQTDLAVDPDGKRLWVRISGMLSDIDSEANEEEIPPFCFELPVIALLPSELGDDDAA